VQKPYGLEDLLEGRVTTPGLSVNVMQSLRPVDAYSNEKVVFFEKRTPLFIQQGSVCLEIVGNLLAGRTVKPLVIDNLFEEVDSK